MDLRNPSRKRPLKAAATANSGRKRRSHAAAHQVKYRAANSSSESTTDDDSDGSDDTEFIPSSARRSCKDRSARTAQRSPSSSDSESAGVNGPSKMGSKRTGRSTNKRPPPAATERTRKSAGKRAASGSSKRKRAPARPTLTAPTTVLDANDADIDGSDDEQMDPWSPGLAIELRDDGESSRGGPTPEPLGDKLPIQDSCSSPTDRQASTDVEVSLSLDADHRDSLPNSRCSSRESQRSEDGPPTLQPDGVAAAAEESNEQMIIAPDNLEIPHLQRKLMSNADEDEADLQNSPPRLSPMCGNQEEPVEDQTGSGAQDGDTPSALGAASKLPTDSQADVEKAAQQQKNACE
uniref:Histone acetyltransferase n=1 Tax=Plectus sambesii TaxID=2011161 RepID=A0A914WFA2_9BILA